MESFSLLKYWRGGGAAAGAASTTTTSARARTTAITPSVLRRSDTEEDNDYEFIDLEFAVPEDDDEDTNINDVPAVSEDEAEMDKEFKFANHGISDLALSLSPSNDIFFKSRLVPHIDHTVVPATEGDHTELPVSLPKPATKLRVLMLGHRRLISLKIEEAVPIMSSLFTRDNSTSRNHRERNPEAEEKLKGVVQKYINKIKPLYLRVSRRYGEKLRFGPKKRLAKSRSAPSAAVAAAPPEALPQRRDDSLLQQQDGIQSAIAHCKRSFNVTGESSETALSDTVGGDGDCTPNSVIVRGWNHMLLG